MNDVREQLHAFAASLRDPAMPAPPGVEQRRLHVYRELVFNNLLALMSGNFPVIAATLGEARWQRLVRDFIAGHTSATPLFPRIGREFIAFLQQRAGDMQDPAWLPELAHYEWVELALQIADDALPAHDPHGDLLTGVPVQSPFAWALAYQWPVQRIGPRYQPEQADAPPTLLLVRRDDAGVVHFSQLSPLVYRLLQLVGERSGRSGQSLLLQLAEEARTADTDAFMHDGTQMLQRLASERTLLGTA